MARRPEVHDGQGWGPPKRQPVPAPSWLHRIAAALVLLIMVIATAVIVLVLVKVGRWALS